MKNVTYGAQRFVTADDVADALLTLGATLRFADAGELVTIPTFDDDHEDSLSLIVAAGIPMTARPAVSSFQEPEASALVDQLNSAAARSAGAAAAAALAPTAPFPGDFDPAETE